MDASNNFKTNPDEPEEETTDSPATTQESITTSEITKTKPSIWIRLLRWLLGILIIFGLGALSVIILLYLPIRNDLAQAHHQLNSLTTQSSSELQVANNEIKRLSSVDTDNKDLQTQLDQANLLLAVRQIRLDIASAQLALSNEDNTKAKLALSNTAQTINELLSLLPPDQQAVVASLDARLKLVLDEIEENAYAANSDLNVMINTLLDLENNLNR